MIRFEKVSKFSKLGFPILDEFDFEIKKNDFVVFVGPSGSGKTSIVNILLGKEKPDQGNVFFNDVNIHRLRKKDLPRYRQRIGFLLQSFYFIPDKTVFENVAYPLEILSYTNREIEENVRDALELTSLTGKEAFYPHELSEGEKQRLAIARAIIHQPDFLIADEPFLLSDEEKDVLERMFINIYSMGTGILLLTRDMHALKKNKNIRFHLIEHGKIVNS